MAQSSANDRTTIRPPRAPKNPFAKYIRALPVFSSARRINAWVRALRDGNLLRNRKNCSRYQYDFAREGMWGRASARPRPFMRRRIS
jgi:hypothetical protein